jgi:uncharacterized RDD family membrane protein YckC
MSDVSQGPGWWQASDLKWYPPEEQPNYEAPPPPGQPPFPQLRPAERPPQPMGAPPTSAYASGIERAGAAIIDAVPGIVALGVIIAIVSDTLAIIGVALLLAMAFQYWNRGYRLGTIGSTIGMSMLKFKEVSVETGEPIGFGTAAKREFFGLLMKTKPKTVFVRLSGDTTVNAPERFSR